jgi:hypothetical protein
MMFLRTLLKSTTIWLALGLAGISPALAQSLEGNWFFRGFYAEAFGGLSKSYDQNFDNGTFNFVNTGGDNYRATVVDGSGTEVFDLELTRSGNTFTGVFPPETENNSVTREEVRIILDGNLAYLITLAKSTSTESGLEGQSFSYYSSVYVLSRSQLPAQSLSSLYGEYSYRLEGQSFSHGSDERSALVLVPAITVRDNVGTTVADFQTADASYSFNLQSGNLGFSADQTSASSGVAVNEPGLTIDNHEIRRYAMAVQIGGGEVVWLQTAAFMGTVNTGTNDQYYVITTAGSVAGRATRSTASPPVFTRDLPSEVAVLDGGNVFLSAEVAGAPAPQYQWYFSSTSVNPFFEAILPNDSRFNLDFVEGSSLAATPSLTINNVTSAMNGYLFKMEAINTSGTVESATTSLKVLSAPTARLPNLSVRTTLAAAQTLSVGFVMTGGTKSLLIRAVGPTLGGFGVTGAMPDPRIGFFNSQGAEVDSNDDWDSSLTTTFNDLGAFGLDANSKDAALRVDLSGLATVQVNGPQAGTVLVEVYDIGDSNNTRLANVSARNEVGTGENILIAGFVVTGDDPKNMLIRGVGPGLEPFIGGGFLVDPLLKVFRSEGTTSTLVATNDNWSKSLDGSFQVTGAFSLPDNSRDAAMVLTLAPGVYTAQVSGADGGTGQAIVEIYELP